MKNIILLTLLLIFSYQVKSQSTYKKERTFSKKCYCYVVNEDLTKEYKEVSCRLTKLNPEELTSLQSKLKDLDYDVDITGVIDQKTNVAFLKDKKESRVRKRAERKRLRRSKKNKKEEISSVKS